jgi:hypothetical protein
VDTCGEEGRVKCHAFRRTTHDSEDEESDSDDKTEEVVHGFSDRQNLNVKTVSKETPVVSSNSTGDSLSKTRNNSSKSETTKQKDYKKPKTSQLSNKWGETVGITDTEGRAKRVVNMSELKNFVPLRMRYNSQFKYYFALIDQR